MREKQTVRDLEASGSFRTIPNNRIVVLVGKHDKDREIIAHYIVHLV